MHRSVMDFVESVVGRLALSSRKTLDVGSYNVNGTVRELFGSGYFGVDMRDGPGVDIVMDAEKLDFVSDSFDVVVSTEMLEHCCRPWRAISEMGRVLSPSGYLILTARGYETGHFPVHDYPHDYWRFSKGAMAAMVNDAGLAVLSVEDDPEQPGVFLLARKM